MISGTTPAVIAETIWILGEHGGDRNLLGVGRGIEAALNRTL